ncbi:MraY family glycosyltransferase [Pseudohalioglobus lutimaris]|uniref:Undecaprenyl-phosphate alpha-N-acetylglucosaminyl 1-phosphate transferase n=1 Tax=Pseudohalioglobus lutimaris TaxID=1737061 RepID=A0A2N5X263_9GAMM|nr:MraY family glycosyltransferase [Pseudohalioglobus lutimaris]PLW68581.1 hypothetical protein C0039_11195 [Pseudohalioglobus lutimaris]
MLFTAVVIVAFAMARLSVGLGVRAGLVDLPDARKLHSAPTPLTGGIFIFLTILICTFATGTAPYSNGMLAIAVGVFLVGVFDDIQHINPWLRLGIQYCAGLALATYGGITLYNVGDLLAMGDIPLLFLAVPLTGLAVAGLSNAYNMIDGIDGLAATTVALPLLVLYLLAVYSGHPHANFLLLMLIPLAVFLVFNLGPNNALLPKMFLGDGGSVTLGFLVTSSLVYFSQGENAVILPVTALWLVTVPLMDMLSTMLRRLQERRPLMEADRGHLHHTLQDMGLNRRQTLHVMALYAGACALTGLLLQNVPEYLSLATYSLLFLAHSVFVLKREQVAEHMQGLLGRLTDGA